MEKQVDWSAIRADYEGGEFSLRQLAEKYQVSKSAVGKRKYRDKWTVWTKKQVDVDISGNTKQETRDVNATFKALTALNLRVHRKLTYEEIKDLCGYETRSAAYKAVQRGLDCMIADVEELRAEEQALLDGLQAKIYPYLFDDEESENDDDEEEKATKKRPGINLFVIDRILAISQHRRKLMNLDKPEEVIANQILVREVPVGWIQQPVQVIKEAES
jgi:predicted DNA-binding protein YlxM (UPF0122 family)